MDQKSKSVGDMKPPKKVVPLTEDLQRDMVEEYKMEITNFVIETIDEQFKQYESRMAKVKDSIDEVQKILLIDDNKKTDPSKECGIGDFS